jgi:hypothetical protein
MATHYRAYTEDDLEPSSPGAWGRITRSAVGTVLAACFTCAMVIVGACSGTDAAQPNISPSAVELLVNVSNFTCSCPPALALWACTEEEYDAIMDGSKCPYYASKTKFTCSCPPALVLWACTKEEYDAIMDGSKCPYYAPKSNFMAKASNTCSCPPSYAIWTCTKKEYDAIMNGTTCPYYVHNTNQDRDQRFVAGAWKVYKECISRVKRRRDEGVSLTTKICLPPLQTAKLACLKSVLARQAKGENIATSICD